MKRVVRPICLFRLSVAAVSAGFALTSSAVHTGTEAALTVVAGDAVTWGAAPPSLPSGAQASVLHGNPAQDGPFVLRLKFPAGFVVPPHRHSKDELVTVISGKFAVINGEQVDRSKFRALAPGSFVNIPAGTSHYAMAETETVVQINGSGPFDITYLNMKDDPRAQ